MLTIDQLQKVAIIVLFVQTVQRVFVFIARLVFAKQSHRQALGPAGTGSMRTLR
jgi:hypothetical protein